MTDVAILVLAASVAIAALVAVLDDGRGGGRADAGQCVQLGDVGLVEVDQCSGGGGVGGARACTCA